MSRRDASSRPLGTYRAILAGAAIDIELEFIDMQRRLVRANGGLEELQALIGGRLRRLGRLGRAWLGRRGVLSLGLCFELGG